jgi:hypothetical protein
MQYLTTLDTSELSDLLAAHTSKYIKMRSSAIFNEEDFSLTREMIDKIQTEIMKRDVQIKMGSEEFPDRIIENKTGKKVI